MDILGLIQALLVGLAIAVAILTLWTIARLRRPRRWTYAAAVARNEPGDPSELDSPRRFEPFTFRDPATGLDLPAWEIAGDAPSGPVAILTPGWSESRVTGLWRVPALAPVCSRIVVWDPPGHGEAPGYSALGVREPAALAALVERAAPESPPPNIVLYGWSMGAGVSIAAAGKAKAAGRVLCVIAEAPYRRLFAPVRNVAKLWGLPAWPNGPLALWTLGLWLGAGPTWRRLDRARLAACVSAPLLVLHGEADEICPARDGVDIASAAQRGLYIGVSGAGHMDLWLERECAQQATAAVRDFIRAALLKTGKGAAVAAATRLDFSASNGNV